MIYNVLVVGVGNMGKAHAKAYYKIDDNKRIQLNIENLTDELYYPHNYDDHQVSVGAPIHATLKIVSRF